MTTQGAAVTALAGYVVFLLLAFGLRSWAHYRRTGTTGFVGISGSAGSAEWFGGVLFVAALFAGGAAPILQLSGVLQPLRILDSSWRHAVGILLFVLGGTGTLWAQFAMGDSWRIGVDSQSKTALVVSGPFRWVRNPIYTAMLAGILGLVLLVPSLVSLVALITLLLAIELQVRLVEEPYLTRVHGEGYRSYASNTGRFLPRWGRVS
jgi:protein-S-isoprenylcysteine O-methyltransferase Ste14